jgi:hypothetical protein
MSSQARGLQNFISDLRNAKSKVSLDLGLRESVQKYSHVNEDLAMDAGDAGMTRTLQGRFSTNEMSAF